MVIIFCIVIISVIYHDFECKKCFYDFCFKKPYHKPWSLTLRLFKFLNYIYLLHLSHYLAFWSSWSLTIFLFNPYTTQNNVKMYLLYFASGNIIMTTHLCSMEFVIFRQPLYFIDELITEWN